MVSKSIHCFGGGGGNFGSCMTIFYLIIDISDVIDVMMPCINYLLLTKYIIYTFYVIICCFKVI